MPVRSLNSSVLRWPDRESVLRALRRWVETVLASDPTIQSLGYFGSYARGDAGVGSDLDILVLVSRSDLPFERRAARYDTGGLPVPAEVLVYTEQEWRSLLAEANPFVRRVARETRWVFRRRSDH